jgi:hypothetical protein
VSSSPFSKGNLFRSQDPSLDSFLINAAKEKHWLNDGPAISDHEGKVTDTRTIDDMLHKCLEGLLEAQPYLFPQGINSKDGIEEKY